MRKPIKLPSQRMLKEVLRYNRRTGKLRWKKRPRKYFKSSGLQRRWNNRYAGLVPAFSKTKDGHLRIGIEKRQYLVHRIIWKLVTGKEPPSQLDHKDRVASNNRWKNLRPATQVQNCMNRKSNEDVGFDKDAGLWRSRITVGKKRFHLGRFSSKVRALSVRRLYARQFYGEFAACV